MGTIKILDESLSNMIAAGEVVENPASLIKELLENSLDAESKYIKIDIKNGGKNVKFSDDGKGMSREDLLLCVERHATSKISTKEDLFNLYTYGFRGEALSSIAAVSKMYISSKTEEDTIGNSINILGGKITNLKEIQKSKGTEIEIKDLFFNTPARLKFLRKDSTENTRIKEIVLNEALANPNVSIVLHIDGKESLRTSGTGMENTIIEIFGLNILKNLKKFAFGYMGNLSLTRSTKDSIFTFVNNRPIKAKIIEEAILDSYYTRLMKGKYPFVILNLDIDPKEVDVNVHPSKKIVKFSNEKEIYHKIYNEITTSLSDNKNFVTYSFEDTKPTSSTSNFFIEEFKSLISEDDKPLSTYTKTEAFKNFEPIKTESKPLNINFESESKSNLDTIVKPKLDLNIQNDNSTDCNEKLFSVDTSLKNISDSTNNIYIENENKNIQNFRNEIKKENVEKIVKKFDYTVIGQFANMFILVEENDQLIIYDQHIVHERILYEHLKDEYYNKKIISQNLLIPVKVSLSLKECDLLKEKQNFFTEFGFEIDQFNDQEFLIRSVPNIDLKDSIENIFFEILEGIKKTNSKNEVIEKMIISMSCKGAIKAHQKLSLEEMQKLIEELHNIGEYTCPHGRPITMTITLNEMEKGFKRK